MEGERGGERGNGWSKEDEDKALPTRRNSRGLVFVQVLQLSLSGSLSCAALSGGKTKKKRERKRHRAVSMDSSDFDLDDCCEMNVKRQNKESLINATKRYMTAAGLGWEGVAGQLKGWLLHHFS